MRPEQVVISVEHASHAVPAELHQLGLSSAFLRSHRGWDPGAAFVGERLAASCRAPLHLGAWSRLVVDLNRSAHHRRVIAADSGSARIPGNQGLSRRDRLARLARYWQPYRDAVEADLDRRVRASGRVLHISVHSFTPQFRGVVRDNDIGLLYLPSHRGERSMADRWDRWLSDLGYRVRRNYPYSGRDDGFCMRMRAERSDRSYLGMEIEMNQRLLRRDSSRQRLADAFVTVLARELARG